MDDISAEVVTKVLTKLLLDYLKRRVNKADILTYLQTGYALVFGSAINLPTLTKFEQASPKTDSDNAKISEKWYID